MILYHGTTERAWKGLGRWKRKKSAPQVLYVVSDLGEAGLYAYETAEVDALDRFDAKPIVMAIDIGQLEGLQFQPDWGWSEVTEESTWKDSLEAVGSFSVVGDVEAYKKLFRRISKREWVEAEARRQ